MKRRVKRGAVLAGVTVAAGIAASVASRPHLPWGRCRAAPLRTVELTKGETFTASLPKVERAGRVWRIARPFDASVVREVRERETAGSVVVAFRAVSPGTTNVVFALTRGETRRAEAARTFRVIVAGGQGCPPACCPSPPIPWPIGDGRSRWRRGGDGPHVTGAVVAAHDPERGPQV